MSRILQKKVLVNKIETTEDLDQAKKIISGVYLDEKKWVNSVENQIAESDIKGNRKISWFIAKINGVTAGLLWLLYDPVMELPAEYNVTL
ncbi:MAG: hypothetical protein JXJ04_26260 [Spirochaetales bacterium]|nr:hypothetical protein [Spirochaetales bacterium]